jgi:hypothetical protein
LRSCRANGKKELNPSVQDPGAKLIAPDASTRASACHRGQHVQMRQRLAESLARIGVQDAREYLLRDYKSIGLA